MKSASSRNAGPVVKRTQSQVRGQPFFLGHVARPLQSVHGGEGDLVLLCVLAGRLPKRSRRLLDVQTSSTI